MTFVPVENLTDSDDETAVEETPPPTIESAPAGSAQPTPTLSEGTSSAPGRTALVGGLSTAVLVATGLYELAGVGGLAASGAAVVGGGALYVAHRRGALLRKRPGGREGATGGAAASRKSRAARASRAEAAHASPAGGRPARRRSRLGRAAQENFPYGKVRKARRSRGSTSRNGSSAASSTGRRSERTQRFVRARQAGRTMARWVNRRTGRREHRTARTRRFRPAMSRLVARLHAWDTDTGLGLYALLARLVARARRLLGKSPAAGQPGDAAEPTSTSEASPTGETPTGQPKPDQPKHDQPRTEPPAYRTRSPRMSSITYSAIGENPLVLMSVEMITAGTQYDVPRMMDLAAHMDAMYQVPENLAVAVTRFGQRLQATHPIHAAVIEEFAHVVKGFSAVIAPARQLAVTFRSAHAEDIARHDAPRVNEHKWDINA
ncbi:hypothetical protein [Nonomuraea dietziae]|uniref:hypothetical protein n=1 Tax=Nonomuraea dietziae TaxID=65515 RepID=UPI0034061E7D